MSNETIVSATAAVIAGLAMFATFWQSMIIREHNRLSVTPRLRVDVAIETEFEVCLVNHGVGPAIVKDFGIYVESHKVSNRSAISTSKELERLLKDLSIARPGMQWHLPSPGDAIGIGERLVLLKVPVCERDSEAIVQSLNDVTIHTDYCSIYEDRIFKLQTAVADCLD